MMVSKYFSKIIIPSRPGVLKGSTGSSIPIPLPKDVQQRLRTSSGLTNGSEMGNGGRERHATGVGYAAGRNTATVYRLGP